MVRVPARCADFVTVARQKAIPIAPSAFPAVNQIASPLGASVAPTLALTHCSRQKATPAAPSAFPAVNQSLPPSGTQEEKLAEYEQSYESTNRSPRRGRKRELTKISYHFEYTMIHDKPARKGKGGDR